MITERRIAPAAPRRRAASLLALAALAAATLPTLASAPAYAAAGPSANADPVLTLRLLGLNAVENDGFVAASGPAAVVQTATKLFALTGDYALYTGPDETGTGYLVLTGDNPEYWVELQIPAAHVDSITNDTTDEVGFYTATAGEGTLDEEVGPGITENVPPAADARLASRLDAGAAGVALASPGVVSGQLIQVPVEVPVNVCGNTINVVGLLNPASGNLCVNK